MAELKDIKGNPDLVCYQGSDPNTPSTAKTDNNNGATIFNRKTGLAVYHVIAPPGKEDGIDSAIRWGAEILGFTVSPPDRGGRLMLSRKPGEPGFEDPLRLAGAPYSLNLQYSQEKDQKTPQLRGCRIDDSRYDEPDLSIEIPAVQICPELKVPVPVSGPRQVAETVPATKPELAMS